MCSETSRAVQSGAHGINVKLAKSGGIRDGRADGAPPPARLGLGCMLGCMVESGLGISAGAQVASLFDHVDLDGNLLLVPRPVAGRPVRRRRPASAGGAGARCPCGICCSLRASSGDPLYGKTMRGVLRYRREDVVAIVDSTRTGETEDGVPVVGSVEEALPLGPTTALVGVVTQGGYFPARVDGAAPELRRARSRRRQRAPRLPRRRPGASARSPRSEASSCATFAGRRPGSRPRPARTSRSTRRSSSRSAPTARSGR